MPQNFMRGNDRLAAVLANPELRADVNALVVEMDQIDRAYKLGLPPPLDRQ